MVINSLVCYLLMSVSAAFCSRMLKTWEDLFKRSFLRLITREQAQGEDEMPQFSTAFLHHLCG